MEIKLDVDEKEVVALRNGGQVPLSLRDKLGDAVHIRDVGWYLCATERKEHPRPFWWTGTEWLLHPLADVPVLVDYDVEPQRLYLDEER